MYIAAIILICFCHNIDSKVSHTTIHSLNSSIPRLQHKIHMLQVTNVAETWQRGYRSVHFLAGYSFLHHWTGFDKAQAKRQCRLFWYTLAAIQALRSLCNHILNFWCLGCERPWVLAWDNTSTIHSKEY